MSAPTVQPTLTPPRWRWLILLPATLGAILLEDPGREYVVIFTLGLLPIVAFVEPLVVTMIGMRAARHGVSGTLRIAATLGAVGSVLAGAAVTTAHTDTSAVTGTLIALIGMAGLLVAWLPPRRGPWKAPAATILFGVLTLMMCSVVPKFEGVKTRAYYAAMRDAAHNIAAFEETVRQDSGHYTGRLADFAPGVFTHVRIERTGPGYNAVTTSEATKGSCAVYVGGPAVAPATRPGEVACTPFAYWQLGLLGEGWLFALALSCVSATLAVRKIPRSEHRAATIES